jgi:cation diffusion facilitator family transporter
VDVQQKLAAGSIGVGIAVLGLKAAAFAVTGSAALYSDAVESIVNVVAAAVAFYTIRLAARPADAEHPYGHSKAEYFSAVLEGVLIVLAALLIFREAYENYLAPRLLTAPLPGLALSSAATAVNAAWSLVIIRAGRRLRSQALVADGRHLMSDVVSSVGVLVGLGLVVLTGVAVLDPLVAALVGLNVLWSGWRVMKESVGGLMDAAAPPETLARIRDIISAAANGAIEAHDLRTRRAGRMTFIDFHLVVAGSTTVSAAHQICDNLEGAIREEIGEALITIHVEPDDKAKHSGIVVL